MSLLATRLANYFLESPEFRAASRATSDWGVRRLLRRAETSESALQNILGRLPRDPALAIDVLSNRDIPESDRIIVMELLLASSDFKKIEGKHTLILPHPPRFFKALARRSAETLASVAGFWRQYFDGTEKLAIDSARMVMPAEKNLDVLIVPGFRDGTDPPVADSRMIIGYKTGRHEFYLPKSGRIKDCP